MDLVSVAESRASQVQLWAANRCPTPAAVNPQAGRLQAGATGAPVSAQTPRCGQHQEQAGIRADLEGVQLGGLHSSHALQEAGRSCQRIIITSRAQPLCAGQPQHLGPPAEVASSPWDASEHQAESTLSGASGSPMSRAQAARADCAQVSECLGNVPGSAVARVPACPAASPQRAIREP